MTKFTGTVECSKNLTDNLKHLYNGNYMNVLLKIIRKDETLYSLIRQALQVKSFFLVDTAYCEEIRFKREVVLGSIDYSLSIQPMENGVSIQGNFSQQGIETTLFKILLNHHEKEKEKTDLCLVSQERRQHELTSDCIAGMVNVATIKGLLEVERGRFLSLTIDGQGNYYKMMREKQRAFISSKTKFSYNQPLFPGELYTIETFIPKNIIGVEVLKIPFYQELRDKEGNIVATSENDMAQVIIGEKKLQRTFIKKL
ncbi:MAG: thioesterase family protein [Candidatus Peribacteria bacterium]|nr:thioesterase family protein [Candidatus Peribacteria bacterium]